jgi:hypothetical protein
MYLSHGRRPPGSSSVSSAVLLVADLFHPINVLTVNLLLNGGVRHTIGGDRTMPVFHPRRFPYHIARLDFLLFTTLLLHPASTGRYDQDLAERMGMPGRAGTGLERDGGARRGNDVICAARIVRDALATTFPSMLLLIS